MISREPGFFIKLTIGTPETLDLYTPARQVVAGRKSWIDFMLFTTYEQGLPNTLGFLLTDDEVSLMTAPLES